MTSDEKANIGQVCLTVVVYGRVQGVGFRYYTQSSALRHGVMGWVRNNYNGTVEIHAEGSAESLNAFLAKVRSGPTGAHVSKVDVQWGSSKGRYRDFRIRS
ncbi:MAG: acylphosphatase [Anaerolineae bacterium]|nr:acylphosphatase [Anaerolineae bacterium]